jgi:hypothetical protein
MNELIITRSSANIRLRLLATTSAIVLAACVAASEEAQAAERPTVWIEGGIHLENITGSNATFVPALDDLTVNGFPDTPTGVNFLGQGSGGFPSFTKIENVLGRSVGAEGRLTFQPGGSDWVFNISASYGRTHSKRHIQEQEKVVGEPAIATEFHGGNGGGFGPHQVTPSYNNYVDQLADSTQSHTIVDFKVGKDVGLGLFGQTTESVFSFGARYVQMNMTSSGHSFAQPGERFYRFKSAYFGKYNVGGEHQNSQSLLRRYSDLHAFGPSLSWDNTTGLWGDVADGQIALDWGANAAVLFGRQSAKASHSTSIHKSRDRVLYNALWRTYGVQLAPISATSNSAHRTETHRVTVPNLGGFAAVSYRFPRAKLSVGYRADFFFGAMDRGLDTHQSVTTGFHGPFATISVGMGG